MKVIIQNDKNRLFSKIDNTITLRTKVSAEIVAGATSLTAINGAGFLANDYLLIDNLDAPKAEITQITSISVNTIYLGTGTTFAHDNKTDIFKIDYNKIRFYEDDTVLATQDIKPNYYQNYAKTVSDTKQYSIDFYNSTTTTASTRGEKIYGYEYLLCGIGDITQFESADIIGPKILDKIDLATRVIRAKFTKQDQTFTDIDNKDLLRIPTALLALHYYFFELIKNKDDISSMKSKMYLDKYDAEIARATDLINATDDDVQVFGQAQCIR